RAFAGTAHVSPPDLSIVIPAFNEAGRLPPAITGLSQLLEGRPEQAEILIVENGSTDRTAELADQIAAEDERVRAIHLQARGKGLAVRTGVLASQGRSIVMCDVDFSMAAAD